jgi:hypothetical protein
VQGQRPFTLTGGESKTLDLPYEKRWWEIDRQSEFVTGVNGNTLTVTDPGGEI